MFIATNVKSMSSPLHLLMLRFTMYVLMVIIVPLIIVMAISFWTRQWTVWFSCFSLNTLIALSIGYLNCKIIEFKNTSVTLDDLLRTSRLAHTAK